MLKSALLLVAVGLSLSSYAQLVNASFEDPGLGSGQFTTNGIDGWSSLGVSGVWNPNAFSDPIPDGTQVGFVNSGGTVAQVSSVALAEGDNSVGFWVGKRLDGTVGNMLVDVWGGGVASGGQVVGGTAIGFLVINASDLVAGKFEHFTINKNLLAGDPLIGQNIGVRFAILSGSQVDFDKLEINAVPEPVSLVVLAAGIGGLARRRFKS